MGSSRMWDRVADELLHVVTPLLFLFYWLMYSPKEGLKWKSVFPWLIYPLVYFLWVLILGSLRGWYPYHFIDVNIRGYTKTVLTIAFFGLSLVFVAISKFMNKSSVK